MSIQENNAQRFTNLVRSVDFSKDGKMVSVCFRDGRTFVWQSSTGKKIQDFDEDHFYMYNSRAKSNISPDNNLIWFSSGSEIYQLTPKRKILDLNSVNDAKWISNTEIIYKKDCEIRVINLASLKKSGILVDACLFAGISPNNEYLLFKSNVDSKTLKLWSIPKKEIVSTFKLDKSRRNIYKLSLISFSNESFILHNGAEVIYSKFKDDYKAYFPDSISITEAAYFSDELVAIRDDNKLYIWNPIENKIIRTIIFSWAYPNSAQLKFSSDGRFIFCGNNYYDLHSDEMKSVCINNCKIASLDNSSIILTSKDDEVLYLNDDKIQIWNLREHQQHDFSIVEDGVRGLEKSPSGEILVIYKNGNILSVNKDLSSYIRFE